MTDAVKIRIKLKNGWGIQILSSDPNQDMQEYKQKLGDEYAGAEYVKTPMNTFVPGKLYAQTTD